MRRLAVVALLFAVLAPAAFATTPSAAAEPGAPDVRIVNLNLLHGAFCPPETNGCQAPDRVALLMRQLEDSACPDIVGLQEINRSLSKLVAKARKTVCDGKYDLAFPKDVTGLDTEQVLTTLAIKSTKVIKLKGNFRTASRVVLTSPIGPLVLVVTHQDGDPETPGVTTCQTCVPPCEKDTSVFQCQTDAAAALADETGGPKAVRVLMGDFNVTSASARYQGLIGAGWVDSHLEAGNAECDTATGTNCTSGRDDKSIEALKDPAARESERIDFIFVKPPVRCTVAFDSVTDGDGDSVGTGLFKATPAVGGPGGLTWASDHTAVSADLTCTNA
jgi:endonuclease/exonuclease/phosphatase family metal-dependent hydrolase